MLMAHDSNLNKEDFKNRLVKSLRRDNMLWSYNENSVDIDSISDDLQSTHSLLYLYLEDIDL